MTIHTTSERDDEGSVFARGRRMNRWLSRGRLRHLARWDAKERARSVLFATTEDNVEIALTRYGRRPSRRHPVILCHGLGANRFSWDLSPQTSLARWLSELGFDVYCLEFRGHGRSQKAGQGGLRYGWGLFDYANRDLPAALEALHDALGANEVHWVGHSMGGIAGLARLAGGETRFRSMTTIASAIDYSGTPSVFHAVSRALPLTRLMSSVPLGALSSLMAPVALAVPNAIDAVNVHHSNVDRELYRRLTAVGLHSVSSPVLRDLATCFSQGGLRDGERSFAHELPGATPTLAVSGSADPQCDPEASARHAHEARAFGIEFGQRDDYGHFDLIMGERAPDEVWPTLHEWLVSHD